MKSGSARKRNESWLPDKCGRGKVKKMKLSQMNGGRRRGETGSVRQEQRGGDTDREVICLVRTVATLQSAVDES